MGGGLTLACAKANRACGICSGINIMPRYIPTGRAVENNNLLSFRSVSAPVGDILTDCKCMASFLLTDCKYFLQKKSKIT
jgi:hypothetical protein